MSKTIAKSLGFGIGVLALAACNPFPADPGYRIDISAPELTGDGLVKLDWTATATITGDFKLQESACDPRSFTVDADNGVLVPGWDPYACSDENGAPVAGQGNIQFYIDGIFMGYYTQTTIDVKLTPTETSDDIRFAYYLPPSDLGFPSDDADGDGEDDAFLACYFFMPGDNLGYARALYDDFLVPGFVPADWNPGTVYDLEFNEVAADDQAPDGVALALYYGAWPWTQFEHFGINVDEALIEGYADFDPVADGQHVFYAELHSDNHAPVYAAGRQRKVTGQLDYNSMPANWCPNVFETPLANPVWYY